MNQRFYRCYLLQTLGPLQLIKSHKEDELMDNNLTRNTFLDYLASLQRAGYSLGRTTRCQINHKAA